MYCYRRPPPWAHIRHIKSLWIVPQGADGNPDPTFSLELVLASSLLRNLPSLKDILWDSNQMTSEDHAFPVVPPCISLVLPSLLGTMHTLSTLRIHNRSFQSLQHFNTLISTLANLRRLALSNVRWGRTGTPVRIRDTGRSSRHGRQPILLERLDMARMDHCHVKDVLRTIISQQPGFSTVHHKNQAVIQNFERITLPFEDARRITKIIKALTYDHFGRDAMCEQYYFEVSVRRGDESSCELTDLHINRRDDIDHDTKRVDGRDYSRRSARDKPGTNGSAGLPSLQTSLYQSEVGSPG